VNYVSNVKCGKVFDFGFFRGISREDFKGKRKALPNGKAISASWVRYFY